LRTVTSGRLDLSVEQAAHTYGADHRAVKPDLRAAAPITRAGSCERPGAIGGSFSSC